MALPTVDEFVEHYDFTNPDFAKFPADFLAQVYRRFREKGCPVVREENQYGYRSEMGGPGHGGQWHILSYENAYEVLQDYKRFSSERPDYNKSIIGLDPPEQNREKKFLTPYFSPERMRRLEPKVREMTDRAIDEFIESGQGDLGLVAWRVPGEILFGELLGFPTADVEMMLRELHPEVYGSEPKSLVLQEDELPSDFLEKYCTAMLEARREHPSSEERDVFDHLLNTKIDGEPFPFDKIVENAVLLVHAGLDTTSNNLTNAFVWLGQHPDQRARLIEYPAMIPNAIEEFVRYSGSVNGIGRIATDDTEIAGCPINKGDLVVANYAAANRDPKEFENPDECIIDRDINRHLGFGVGYHRCLGSNLARLELRVGLEQVLARIPDYRFVEDDPPQFRTGIMSGHIRVPVVFTPGRRL